MNYYMYFNFVCDCVDKATQFYKDGKDNGLVLGNVVQSLCAADEKAHKLAVLYKALCRIDREDYKEVLVRKTDECFNEIATQERGGYFVIRPECKTIEQMRRLSVIQNVLLNREERVRQELDTANELSGLYDVLDDYAEDIGAAIHGEDIEC